jgi:bifunctional DNA-binding transcriptional regulator/antitoxin component of YhaV-PrlF toxin-antitoxin module
MIKVVRKIADASVKTLGIKKGDLVYVLNYRKGKVILKNFPDRSSYTSNVWLKKLYEIDDAIYLFDATKVKDFKLEKNRILDMIAVLMGECEQKRDECNPLSMGYFVFEKRIEILTEWAERIEAIKPKHPLERHLKKIRNQHPKLR